nr:hypothetical protein [Pseudomonas helmanticensis]
MTELATVNQTGRDISCTQSQMEGLLFENKSVPFVSDTKPTPMGCVFAKSCNLPDGEINHTNPAGFVPVEKLADYGLWAVLATGAAITAEGTSLQLVGGSTTGSAIAQRLGGSLALGLLESAGTLAAGAAIGTVALLMPNTCLAPDSAFYKTDQYRNSAAHTQPKTRLSRNRKDRRNSRWQRQTRFHRRYHNPTHQSRHHST